MRRALGLSILAVMIAGGCGDEQPEECNYTEDPRVGPRPRCLASRFDAQGKNSRNVGGVLLRGDDPQSNAALSLSSPREAPAEEFRYDLVVDTSGFFGGLRTTGNRYDLIARFDKYVVSYAGLGWRFVFAGVEGGPVPTLARGWRTRVDLRVSPPPTETQTVSLFAIGDKVFGTEGTYETGFSIVASEYALDAGIVVVVHEKGKDLSTATAWRQTGLRTAPDVTQLVTVTVDPIAKRVKRRVDIDPASGATTAELFASFSRTSFGKLATLPSGVEVDLPVIGDATTALRVQAEADGSLRRSAERTIDSELPPLVVVLPTPPRAVSPADNAEVDGAVELVAEGQGVFEHVLTSEANGSEIRLISSHGGATLPDFARVGASAPKGRYRWTVRHYPGLKFVDELTGFDARRFTSMAASAPRTLNFR